MVWLVLMGASVLAVPVKRIPAPVRAAAIPTAVRITHDGSDRVGSGVVVGVRKKFVFVLTAAHVVPMDGKPRAETFGQQGDRSSAIKCEVLFRDVPADLAVLRYPAGEGVIPTAAISAEWKQDEKPAKAWAIGCDAGARPRLTAVEPLGSKLVKRKDGKTTFFWQVAGETVQGRSGGALLDETGRVIGICSGNQDGKSYYAHVKEIRGCLAAANLLWLLE